MIQVPKSRMDRIAPLFSTSADAVDPLLSGRVHGQGLGR